MAKKQSPRDRLISMMYLVLTAMLALQVSSQILEKFVLINKSIQTANSYQIQENVELLKRVEKAINDSGNRESDVELLKKMILIHEKTDKMVGHIEGIKLKLLKLAGNKDLNSSKNKKIKGLKNDHVVTALMINNKNGVELKMLLNSYIKFLNGETGKQYRPIALDARDIDFLKDDPNAGRKNFEILNFYKTPLAAALATLSQLESDIIYKEADALATLARTLGAEDYKFETLVPMIIPKSNIVASGDNYEADLVLAAFSSSAPMKMNVNGNSISIVDGIGKVKIPAILSKSKKGADEAEAEQKSLKVDIEIKNQKGQSTIFSKIFNYFVAKPIIRVDAGNVARLYKRCKNPLNIQVPALGKNYNPRFVANGAEIINQGGGKVIVIPTEQNVSLDVYQGKVLLGTETFRVRNVPLPQIKVSSRGKILSEKNGMPAPGPRSITVSILADEGFKELLPEESRYKISKGVITLARGEIAVAQLNITSKTMDIKNLAALARSGDRIIVEVTEVFRATSFNNGKEKVKIGTIIKTIPIT